MSKADPTPLDALNTILAEMPWSEFNPDTLEMAKRVIEKHSPNQTQHMNTPEDKGTLPVDPRAPSNPTLAALRDTFAGQILMGWLSARSGGQFPEPGYYTAVAQKAYALADVLLVVRDAVVPNPQNENATNE